MTAVVRRGKMVENLSKYLPEPIVEWEITDQGPRRYYNHISMDENRRVPYCKCAPSNVLYWELSDADTTDCPVHYDVPACMARIVNARLIEVFGKVPPKPRGGVDLSRVLRDT